MKPVFTTRFRQNVPLYVQIFETLLGRIASGELAPNDRLPTERELSQSLNVSRMTLRQALDELESRGLVVRRPGSGTFVAEPKIERTASKLVAFTDAMQQKGYRVTASIVVFEKRLADVSAANQLGLALSAPVYYYQRIRLVNQEPLLLEKCTLPVGRFPGLERYDMEHRSVYEILRTEYGVKIDHSQQSLEAIVAMDYEAALLKIAPGAPIMLQRRLAFDFEGVPIETGDDLYRGDRFRFITDMAPFAMEE